VRLVNLKLEQEISLSIQLAAVRDAPTKTMREFTIALYLVISLCVMMNRAQLNPLYCPNFIDDALFVGSCVLSRSLTNFVSLSEISVNLLQIRVFNGRKPNFVENPKLP
jgi:biotin synthase-related radical SAM superfamily protein